MKKSNKMIHIITMFTLVISIVSCGAISRKDIFNQKVTIKDKVSGERLSNVQITVNNEVVGVTDDKGQVVFLVSELNYKSTYDLKITKDNYATINMKIANKVGGGYAFMDSVGLLFGLIPGIINLSVDGVTGEWYTFKKRLVLKMQPINTK
ncbi:MAG: hypothetical protein ACRC0X_07930 [Brevinema sp.]